MTDPRKPATMPIPEDLREWYSNLTYERNGVGIHQRISAEEVIPLIDRMASLESRLHSTNESLGAEIARGRSMTERISELESALSDSDCCKKVRSITHSKLEAENRELRALAACCYQFVGCRGMDEKWLDALSAASHGEPFSTDNLLPCSRLEDETAMPSEPSQAESLLAIENRELREKLENAQRPIKDLLWSHDGVWPPNPHELHNAQIIQARRDALEEAAECSFNHGAIHVARSIRALASPTGQK